MNRTLLLLGVVAVALLARRARGARVAPATGESDADREAEMGVTRWTGTRRDVERGIIAAAEDIDRDDDRAAAILARWGDVLRRFPRPVPPELAARIIARESGGSATASGDAALGELGLWQLSRDEARAVGVFDPRDPVDSTRGAQELYARAIRAMPEPDIESQLLVALLSRSIGLGDTRRLRNALAAGPGSFRQKVRAFVEAARGKPSWARMRGDAMTWARRVMRGCLRAEQAMLLGWIGPGEDLSREA